MKKAHFEVMVFKIQQFPANQAKIIDFSILFDLFKMNLPLSNNSSSSVI